MASARRPKQQQQQCWWCSFRLLQCWCSQLMVKMQSAGQVCIYHDDSWYIDYRAARKTCSLQTALHKALLYIHHARLKVETFWKLFKCALLSGELLIWIKTIEAPYGRMVLPLGHVRRTSDSFFCKKTIEGAPQWDQNQIAFDWIFFCFILHNELCPVLWMKNAQLLEKREWCTWWRISRQKKSMTKDATFAIVI